MLKKREIYKGKNIMKSTHKNHNYSKEFFSNDKIWKCDWNDSQIRGVLSYPNSDNDVAVFPYI